MATIHSSQSVAAHMLVEIMTRESNPDPLLGRVETEGAAGL